MVFFQVRYDKLKQDRMSKVKPHMILTPSLSVVLFTLDTDPQPSKMECCRQTFGKSPWKFHHVTELNTSKQRSKRIHVRQEFYELMPSLPLFSMSPTHFGKQILRINIFTHNHSKMVKFYSLLFGLSPTEVREDFCFFNFSYLKTLTLQLSLKGGQKLIPYPTSGADLVLSLPEVPSHMELEQLPNGMKCLCDPDDNSIIISLMPTEKANIPHPIPDSVQLNLEIPKPQDVVPSFLHSEKIGSEISHKIKAIELEEKEWETKLSEARPDVIPKEDCILAAARLRPSGPTVRRLGRSRSPANPARKLKFQTKSINVSEAPGQEMNYSLHKSNDSVDIVASF